MSALPVWLLDIDGVLNAISGKPDRAVWAADDWLSFDATDARTGETWPMLIARPVVDFIRTVHEKGRAEIRWHTTWQESALDVADRVGLPTFGVQSCPEYDAWYGVCGWWKLPAAERVIDEGRPLIWTDDDATLGRIMPTPYDRVKAWPNLVIAPQQRLGLTRKQLRAIDEHLTLLEESA